MDSEKDLQDVQANPSSQDDPAPEIVRRWRPWVFLIELLALVLVVRTIGFPFIESTRNTWLDIQTKPFRLHRTPSDENPRVGFDWSTVVRPLVGEDELFDIVVTVWATDRYTDEPISWEDGVLEVSIFEDVVFSGLTLKSKNVQTQVNLSIPVERFRKNYLENMDLRASFVLIPRGARLLKYLTDYTSWRPTEEWTMREIKARVGNHHSKLLFTDKQNEAIDSFAAFGPLIDFQPIKRVCYKTDLEPESGQWNPTGPWFADFWGGGRSGWWSDRAPPRHPYVVTRTLLQISDVTVLYDSDPFFELHENLQTTMDRNGCEKSSLPYIKDERDCMRTFGLRLNAETLFYLEVPNASTKKAEKQYAYAPFLYVSPRGWGPEDLVPMPLDPENPDPISCPEPLEPSQEESEVEDPMITLNDTLEVVWNIEFSSASPLLLVMAEGTARNKPIVRYPFEMYIWKSMAIQSDFLDVTKRFCAGFKFSSSRFVQVSVLLAVLRLAIGFIHPVLSLLYWYTLKSTAGVSRVGAVMLLLGEGVDLCDKAMPSILRPHRGFSPPLTFDILNFLATVFVVLKGLLQIGIVRQFPWIWRRTLERTDWEQRASARLETQGRIRIISTIIAGTFLYIIAFTCYLDFPLTARLYPNPQAQNTNGSSKRRAWLPKTPKPSSCLGFTPLATLGIHQSMRMAASILQSLLNYRSKTFAGMYKASAWLGMAGIALYHSVHFSGPWLAAGTQGPPLMMSNVVYLVVFGVVPVVQSVVYPSVHS